MISVIIPTYNNGALIERAVSSVLAQTYSDYECIVVIDGSTDDTYSRLRNLFGNRIKIVNEQINEGVGKARKKGLKIAKGEFVTFLDSDDVLTPDFLEKSILLQQQHNSDVVYTSFRILFENGIEKVIPAGDFLMEGEATVQLHFWSQLKFLTGKLIRKSLCDKVPWSEKRVGEDVQTLFFLTYEAEKVRSSSYSGYIHKFREGSLLANKPEFYCYCESTLSGGEIVDFLIEKGDEKLYSYLLKTMFAGLEVAKKVHRKLSPEERKENSKRWREVKAWFKAHEKYFFEKNA